MKLSDIPQDDVDDVIELADKICTAISDVLKEHDKQIGLASIVHAVDTLVFLQSDTTDQILSFKRAINGALNRSIIRMQRHESDR